MGDIVRFTTWPKHQNVFYPIKSSAISFDVCAYSNAGIGLAKNPGAKCDYWVCIGDNGRSWIKKEHGSCKTASTPQILGNNTPRRFWITWHSGSIQLGRHGDNKPIVTYPNNLDLNYVTFTILSSHINNCINWKIELPPALELTKEIKSISGGELNWVQAGNQLPNDSLVGGFENETLYIIRAHHIGSLTPGKFVPSEGVGYISWGGDSHVKHEFQVLCGFDCIWVPTSEDRIPIGAFESGHSEDQNERLYMGRAEHKGFLIPGKVQPSHKVCYIPFEGKEIPKKTYEILVVPSRKNRCLNSTFITDVQIVSESDSDHDENSDDNHWSDQENDENIFAF